MVAVGVVGPAILFLLIRAITSAQLRSAQIALVVALGAAIAGVVAAAIAGVLTPLAEGRRSVAWLRWTAAIAAGTVVFGAALHVARALIGLDDPLGMLTPRPLVGITPARGLIAIIGGAMVADSMQSDHPLRLVRALTQRLSRPVLVACLGLAAVGYWVTGPLVRPDELELPWNAAAGRRLLATAEARVAMQPKRFDALLQLGMALAYSERYEDARPVLERALAADPDDWRAQFFLGWAEFERGAYRDAVRHTRRAGELEPRYEWAHVMQARSHEALREVDAADSAYARAIRASPLEFSLHVERAALLVEARRFVSARGPIAAAARLSPGDWRPPMLSGLVARGEQRLEDAAAQFDSSIVRAPRQALPRMQLAVTRYLQGDAARTVSLMDQALALDSTLLTRNAAWRAVYMDARAGRTLTVWREDPLLDVFRFGARP